jgi:hypothetical protein
MFNPTRLSFFSYDQCLALSDKPASASGHITNGLLHQQASAPGIVLYLLHTKIP